MQDFLSRHDRMQRLNTRPAPPVELDEYYSRHDDDLLRGGNPIASLMLIIIGMTMGMVLLSVARSCDKSSQPERVRCIACHNGQPVQQSQILAYTGNRLFSHKIIKEI